LGRKWRLLLAAGGLLCASACQAAPDFAGERSSQDARYAAAWVLQTGDSQDRPFAVVDKKEARIYVFEARGRLLGASSVLTGSAAGDDAAPDIAGRDVASLAPDERTTPAGRFASQPGRNDKGEDIVWIDYAAALAIHRLRPAPASERRPARMTSTVAAEHRISAGCVVVPVAFYESVVAPSLGRQRGVVYVLPESSPVRSMFGAIDVSLRDREAP
jgi:hypothetical protein